MGRFSKIDRAKYVSYDAKTNRSTCLACNKKFKGKVLHNIKRHYRLMHKYDLDDGNDLPIPKSLTGVNIVMSESDFMKCCVGLVAVRAMPFCLFDDEDYFRKIIKPYENAYDTKINSSLITTQLDSYGEEMRNFVCELLRNKMVCIKLDIVSRVDNSILAINVQIIQNFEIQNFTLGMIELKENYTASFLKEAVFNVINKFGVQAAQIYYLTTDNGANIGSTAELLQEHNNATTNEYEDIHHSLSAVMSVERCPVHMLQLAVHDVYKTIAKELTECRNATCALRKIINNGNFEGDIQLPTLDNTASWSSTYEMLTSLLQLCAFVNEHGISCEINWIFIQNFIDAFKSVVEFTKNLRSENYIFGDFYRDWLLCETRLENIQCNTIADVLLEAMKARKLKLLENNAFIAALYMDRRFNYMDTPFLNEIQKKKAVTHIINTSEILNTLKKSTLTSMETEDSHVDNEFLEISNDAFDLLERKINVLTQQPNVVQIVETVPQTEPLLIKIEKDMDIKTDNLKYECTQESNDRFDLLERKVNSLTQQSHVLENVQSIRQKLESLAYESRLPFRTDAIKNWQDMQITEPILSELSEVILSVPCSQTSIERIFSALSQNLSENNSNLNPDNIKNLLFIRLNENLFENTILP